MPDGKHIDAIVPEALEAGAEEFDKRFSLPRATSDGKDLRDSQNDLDRIRGRIFSYIKEHLKTVDWSDRVAVDAFCNDLEPIILHGQKRFVRAFGRVQGSLGGKKWQEFSAWITQLRTQTKEQIFTEIARLEKLEKARVAAEKKGLIRTAVQPVETDEDIEDIVEPPEDFYTPFRDIARGSGVSDESIQTMVAVAESARGQDEKKLEEALLHAVELIAALERQRKDAEALWTITEEQQGLAKRIEELEYVLEETREVMAGVAEQATTKDETIARLESMLLELRRELEVSRAVERPKEVVREVVKEVMVEQKIDYTGIKNILVTRIENCDQQIDHLNDLYLRIQEWLRDIEKEKKLEFGKLRMVADEEAVVRLDVWEQRVHEKITTIREWCDSVEQAAQKFETMRKSASDRLRAIQLVEEELPPEAIVDLSSLTELRLPGVETLMEDQKPTSDVIAALKTKQETNTKIDGLPFVVEFTEKEHDTVRYIERLIGLFAGQSEEEIRKALPYETADEFKKTSYEDMLKSLREGTFLQPLKKAVVILGALRFEGEFRSRMSKTVGHALVKVKIAPIMSPGAAQITGSFFKANMLAGIMPELRLFLRKASGSHFGPANELIALGQMASLVWTADVIASGEISKEQIIAMYNYIQEKDKAAEESREG